MTVRGGGIPRRPLALTPNGRMGPPLRSFAADAHDCIMVRVLGPTGYKVVARLNRAPKAGSPLIVIATALSVPSCSKPSRYGLARAKHAARLVRRPILTASARIDLSDARVEMKKRTLRSNQETDEGKRCAALANSLTKKAPYKGLGAESEEKREPASDIDTGVVDGLKALDPDGRLEKRPYSGHRWMSQSDRRCVKTHTSAKCRKHNSPARHRTSRVQYDLTPRDAIARRYFYVWRDR